MDNELDELYHKTFQPLYNSYLQTGQGFEELITLLYKTHPELLEKLSPDESRSLEFILKMKEKHTLN